MTVRPYTWDQLRLLALARQFPRVRGHGPEQLTEVLTRIGPLQTQTARSTFLGLAARLPGVTHAEVTEAFETMRIVRGSTLRGTVHSSLPSQHVWLDHATRLTRRRAWERELGLRTRSPEHAWEAIERYATDDWRTPEELIDHLRSWILEHEVRTPESVTGLQRWLGFAHGGLIRRPLSGGWDGQGAPGYRAVDAALTEADPQSAAALRPSRAVPSIEAIAALALLHVRSHGPSSRRDIAWWSGLGLQQVDTALTHLSERLIARPGPDGQDYWDIPEAPRVPDDLGPRLLPEFDAVLCGYDSKARDRFVTPDQMSIIWNHRNGLMKPPLLYRGALAGWWRLDGTGRKRRLTVTSFPGVEPPTQEELRPAVTAVATVLAVTIENVEIRGSDAAS